MKKSVGTVMGAEEQAMIVAAEGMNKSDKIKALFEGGLDVKDISELLQIRYNHAYNVIQNYVIVNDIEVEKSARSVNAKRLEVIQILENGGKLIDAARATKSSYNYVWKISQDMKKEAAPEFDVKAELQKFEELKVEEEVVLEAPKSKKGRKVKA